MKVVVISIFTVVFISSSWGCVTDSQCDPGYLCLKNHCICTTCNKGPISKIKGGGQPSCDNLTCNPETSYCDEHDICIDINPPIEKKLKIKASELECDETNCDYGTGYCDENNECAALPPPIKSDPILKIKAGQPVCDETTCPLDIGLCSESGICVHHSIKKAAPPPCVLGRECPNGCGCLHGKCLCRRPFLNTFNPNQGPESNEQQPPPFCAIVTDCPRGYQCVDNECVLVPTAFVETLEEEEAPHAATRAPHPCESVADCPRHWPYACEHGICVDKCIPGNAC